MQVRFHRGFGHGLRSGETRAISCEHCQAEQDKGIAPLITDGGEPTTEQRLDQARRTRDFRLRFADEEVKAAWRDYDAEHQHLTGRPSLHAKVAASVASRPKAMKVCIACEEEQGKPHKPWCPVVTGTLGTLPVVGEEDETLCDEDVGTDYESPEQYDTLYDERTERRQARLPQRRAMVTEDETLGEEWDRIHPGWREHSAPRYRGEHPHDHGDYSDVQ